jgi:hypothetical protein
MGRPANIIPSQELKIMLPEDLFARLRLHLFRESSRCIPRGALSAFFIERLNDFFSGRAQPDFRPGLQQETYMALENIYAVASKKGADPQEALRAIARWSRIYADKLLEPSK